MLNFSLDSDRNGMASDLVKNVSFADGEFTFTYEEPLKITKSNGYELKKQAGLYYALQFAKDVVKDSSMYTDYSWSPSQSHTGAQDAFLYGAFESSRERAAMLIDGNWWINEATTTFNNMATRYGQSASKSARRFGVMPIPKVSEDAVGKRTIIDQNSTFCFINKSNKITPVHKQLAKLFLQFCHSNEGLTIFQETVGMAKPYTYKIEGERYNNMNAYAKSTYDLHTKANIVYPYVLSDTYINNVNFFNTQQGGYAFKSKVGNDTLTNPFTAFKNNTSLTPKQYFDGIYRNFSTNWLR